MPGKEADGQPLMANCLLLDNLPEDVVNGIFVEVYMGDLAMWFVLSHTQYGTSPRRAQLTLLRRSG